MNLAITITKKGGYFDGKPIEVFQASLDAAISEATMFLERKVKELAPKGVGGAVNGLAATIHGEVPGKGTPAIKGIIAHQSVYGDVIEKGRTAGKSMPPEGSLIRWIELKMGLPEPLAKKIEFVVRRKIGQKGFPGAHMFETALEQGMPRLQGIFDRCGFEIARKLS